MTEPDELLEMFETLKENGGQQDRDLFGMFPDLFNPLDTLNNNSSFVLPASDFDKEIPDDCDFLGNNPKIADPSYSMTDENSQDDDITMRDVSDFFNATAASSTSSTSSASSNAPITSEISGASDVSQVHPPVKLPNQKPPTAAQTPRQSARIFQRVMNKSAAKSKTPTTASSSTPRPQNAAPAPSGKLVSIHNLARLLQSPLSLFLSFQSNVPLTTSSIVVWLQYYMDMKLLLLRYNAMMTPLVNSLLTMNVDIIINYLIRISHMSNISVTDHFFINQFLISYPNYLQKPIFNQSTLNGPTAGNPKPIFSPPSSYHYSLMLKANPNTANNNPPNSLGSTINSNNSHSQSHSHSHGQSHNHPRPTELIFSSLNKRKSPERETTSSLSKSQVTTPMNGKKDIDKARQEPPAKKIKVQ